LMPYLIDGYDLYADAEDDAPKLLPIARVDALYDTSTRTAWLRVKILRNSLAQRRIGPQGLLTRARVFGERFHLVTGPNSDEYVTYESTHTFSFTRNRWDVVYNLCDEFDGSLFGVRRNVRGPRRYVVLSDRPQLMSHEAVTLCVLFHLSDMVRYRPFRVEHLRGTRYFWLFASWADRACENFLLSLASRIADEEHFIE
jgi:hypothetical protein